MITFEDLRNFAIDLEDKDYIVSYGSIPDHKAYTYRDREQFTFSIKKDFRKSGERFFSLNDYSDILENIEELHDRIDEEYRLLNIKFELNYSLGLSEIDTQTFPNNWKESLPNTDQLFDKVMEICEKSDKEIKKKFGQHMKQSIPTWDDPIITCIDFTFKCRKYEKMQSDKNIRNLYNSIQDEDIKKKMKDLFKDEVKFEGIKRFKEF